MSSYLDENINEMKSYSNYVKELAARNSEAIFDNSSIEHYFIVMCELLKSAKHKIQIFAGSMKDPLKEKISSYLTEAAFRLNNENAIQIITTDLSAVEEFSELKDSFDNINDLIGKKVISYLPLIAEKEVQHFCVVDGKAWRFEEIHTPEQMDAGVIKAKVCFNNKNIGQNLQKTFRNIWGEHQIGISH